MNKHLYIRIILDCLLSALFLLALAYPMTGNAMHEWLGIALFAAVFVHNVLNWRWYASLFKGAYSLRRILWTVVNILLVICMLLVAYSGIMLSRDVLGFLRLQGSWGLRELHTFAAYWGLLLMGLHAGFHGDMFANAIAAKAKNLGRGYLYSLRLIGIIAAAYGAYAFLKRGLLSRLMMRATFSFTEGDTLAYCFFDYLAILWLFAFIGYYGLKISGKDNRINNKLK